MSNAASRDAPPGSYVANHVVGTLVALTALLIAASVAALGPDVLVSVRAVPPEIAGRIREARGFQQSAFGQLLHSQWAFRPPQNRNPLAGFGPLAKSFEDALHSGSDAL